MQTDQDGQDFYVPNNPSPYIEDQTPHRQPQRNSDSIEWQASEYIHHDKGVGWFITVGLIALGLLAAAIWFSQWTFAVLIVIMAVAFGYFGVRKPRILHYRLSPEGIKINNKQYPYSDFRAFGVSPDGAFYSIMLLPIKRLAPGVNIYFAQADGEQIVDILGTYLPMEKMQPDLIDKAMRKLRF